MRATEAYKIAMSKHANRKENTLFFKVRKGPHHAGERAKHRRSPPRDYLRLSPRPPLNLFPASSSPWPRRIGPPLQLATAAMNSSFPFLPLVFLSYV